MAFLIPIAAGAAIAGAAAAAASSGGGEKKQPSSDAGLIAMANASKESAIVQSNNMVLAAQAQAATMRLGILENSKNAQFQTMAWLTERLDAMDTKLQVAVIQAKQDMKAEHYRHIEAMSQVRIDWQKLQRTSSTASDLPPPAFDDGDEI